MEDVIINGDSEVKLRDIPDESVDCVVTDPPYGMSFMGKVWDKALPSVAIWKECLRVLKPGAFAFVMCIPRQDCLARMIVNLEDAGFLVNFSPIYHTFATGFPKAANLSKLADKRAGVEREVVGRYVPPQDNPKNRWTDSNKTLRQNLKFAPGEDVAAGHQADHTRLITVPATPEAKALEGAYAGLSPKPAVEVVLCVMRPRTEKTYLDQALSNGKGCTWLDDGQIPYEGYGDKEDQATKNPHTVKADNAVYGDYSMCHNAWPQPQGRFAPNLLVSDDVLNDGRVTKSSGGEPLSGEVNRYGVYGSRIRERTGQGVGKGDSGSYSRYFSLDAWSEKNLPESVKGTFPFLIVPKASKSEKNAGLDELPDKQMYKCDNSGESLEIFGTTDGGRKPRKNSHATVKPIKLMSYLITIGSRPGDVILDPFCGSGSTLVAAAILDRRYIGIELDPEMCDIAERRIKWHVEQLKTENSQLKLDFGGANEKLENQKPRQG